MCELLGTEPKEDEIPIEYEDLQEEVQEALAVYNMLQDSWNTMDGQYLGKVMSGVTDILDILGIEDKSSCLAIILILDRVRGKLINAKKPAK